MALERKPFAPAYVLVHRFRKHPPLFFFLPLKIQPSEGMTVGHNKFLPLKIKRGDDNVPIFFLPLNFQPSEGMTVGHSKCLPLKIQPGEEMTVRHNKFLPLKIQPSEEMTVSQYFFFYR